MKSQAKQSHKDLGEAVKLRRKARQLHQQELADLAGCGRLFVSELEAGKPSVRLDLTFRVLAALGLQLQLEEVADPSPEAARPLEVARKLLGADAPPPEAEQTNE